MAKPPKPTSGRTRRKAVAEPTARKRSGSSPAKSQAPEKAPARTAKKKSAGTPRKRAAEAKAPKSASRARRKPDFSLEDELGAMQGRTVVGVDESGRSPLAGPVVAAAVWLHRLNFPPKLAALVNDCKQVKDGIRQELYIGIVQNARIGLGQASVEEIERFNILQASLLAMERAVAALGLVPDVALIDGNQLPRRLPCPAKAVVEGDCRSLSIAAASIVAKVTRDRIMNDLARVHPGYGWEHNRGYGTAEHLAALQSQGVSPQHRRSFAPVRARLETAS